MNEPVVVQPKPALLSKMVWLGIILTLSGIIPLVADILRKSVIDPADVVLLFGGVLAVVLRVWFTDVPIA